MTRIRPDRVEFNVRFAARFQAPRHVLDALPFEGYDSRAAPFPVPYMIDTTPSFGDATCPAVALPTLLGIDIGGTGCKLAALRGDAILWTVKRGYRTPSALDLVNAIRHGLGGREADFSAVGLCVP